MNKKFLTLNWHFINKCNMQCKFCFACKETQSISYNHDTFLEKCSTVFNRINFVGGEPTLFKDLPYLVEKAHALGMETSIVTNGFQAIKGKISKKLLQTFSKMKTIGLSVDSLNHTTNTQIGRHVNGKTLTESEILDFCEKIKKLGIELKINTVVNKFNKNEDFNSFITKAKPDRWKIFQVMPINNQYINNNFDISDEEYKNFLLQHSSFQKNIFPENNDLIKDSYIMINKDGYFIGTAPYTVKPDQNSLYKLDTNIIEELEKMSYDFNKYNTRYEPKISSVV